MFLSNGDYNFPFDAVFYTLKHFYAWSFQTGAPNIDGIMRLPSVMLNEVIFHLFGNLAVSYFYIALVLVVSVFSAYVFLQKFLKVRSRLVLWSAAILFAVNPVFLGNLSKIGLTLAAAMLPLCLVLLQKFFTHRSAHYLVGWVMLLIISLIHPFTFAVNLGLTSVYFIYKWHQVGWKRGPNVHQILGVGILSILLCLFFILPIYQVGSISKDALTQDVAPVKTDYTALVDIANTDGLTNAFSLSRGVLKDYEFYDQHYRVFYIVSIFALYALAIGLFIRYKKAWTPIDRATYLTGMATLLILLLLSTGTAFSIDVLIKGLIGLPGGWMFRSPLKWQLYIPFFLMLVFAIALKYSEDNRIRKYMFLAFGLCFVLMNGFLAKEIYQKLLTPRHVTFFGAFQKEDLQYKSMINANSQTCNELGRTSPELRTELNQIVTSKQLQVRNAKVEDLKNIQLNDYDYIVGCSKDLETALKGNSRYRELASIDSGTMTVYKNQQSEAYITTFDTLYQSQSTKNIAAKDHFTQSIFNKDFNYVKQLPKKGGLNTSVFSMAFEDLNADSIGNGAINTKVPATNKKTQLYATPDDKVGLNTSDPQNIRLSTQSQPGYSPLTAGSYELPVAPDHSSYIFHYTDPQYGYKNLIPNNSFESELWKKKVGDCSAYNRNSKLSMERVNTTASDGMYALKLSTQAHVACTDPGTIRVKPGAHYLLSFDYRSASAHGAGYAVSFQDNNNPGINGQLTSEHDSWSRHDREIVVPGDVENISLFLYARPDSTQSAPVTVYYDNVRLVAIPDLQNNYFVTSSAAESTKTPEKTSYTFNSPTSKTVTVSGASQPFYLSMKDGYSNKWLIANTTTDQAAHFSLNTGINGWYIKPAELCASSSKIRCTKDAAGHYSFTLTITYSPQKWFVMGLGLSTVTWAGGIAFIVYKQRKQAKVVVHRIHV